MCHSICQIGKKEKIYKNRVKIYKSGEKMEFREIEYINRDTEKVEIEMAKSIEQGGYLILKK